MPRPKRTEYAVEIDGRNPSPVDPAWTPEHLVLASLARCSLGSLAHHAKRDGLRVDAAARASGAVSRREDGSWGFVDIACEVEAKLEPEPEDLADIVGRAERGCFIGASLRPKPRYEWIVNGEGVQA